MTSTRATKNLIKEALLDEEVLSTIKETICQALDSKFQQLIERIDKQDGTILDLHHRVKSIENDLKSLQKKQQLSEERNKFLEKQLNNQEQYSRRNCIRLFGVPEKVNENTNERVCEIAQKQLGVNLQLQDIDRSHRVPRRIEPVPEEGREIKPRAIIIKLTSYQHRQKLLQNRKKLKNTKMSMFEDLTNANRSLLWEAVKASKLPQAKILSAWSINGKVRTLSICLCLVAFIAMEVKAQTDRTAEFRALCEKYSTELNNCEAFIENLPSQVTAEERALLNLAENNEMFLVEEGEQEVSDACDILETVCARVVSFPASARFRRSSSVSAESSSVESSETSD